MMHKNTRTLLQYQTASIAAKPERSATRKLLQFIQVYNTRINLDNPCDCFLWRCFQATTPPLLAKIAPKTLIPNCPISTRRAA
jgi:hypothetical protein